MTLRNILVAYSNGQTSRCVLKFALALRSQSEALVTALHVTPPVMEETQILTWMPEKLMQQVRQANEKAPTLARQSLDTQLADLGEERAVRWRNESGEVSDTLAAQTRLYDLLIVGKYKETTEEVGAHVRSERIVTQAARPVIVVPEIKGTQEPVQKMVIAWDGGMTATRALNDAIQLLPFVPEIEVFCVTKKHADASPFRELKEHLSLHNPAVKFTTEKPSGNTAELIKERCEIVGADLLVIGSRGSNRLRGGLVAGGTGRAILESAQIPVFLSH